MRPQAETWIDGRCEDGVWKNDIVYSVLNLCMMTYTSIIVYVCMYVNIYVWLTICNELIEKIIFFTKCYVDYWPQ